MKAFLITIFCMYAYSALDSIVALGKGKFPIVKTRSSSEEAIILMLTLALMTWSGIIIWSIL